MLLFTISFIIIFLTSYLITSTLSKQGSVLGFLYIPIIFFAEIILTLEILSFSNAIVEKPILFTNIIFLLISALIFKKTKSKLWKYDICPFLKKVKNSLLLDKSLLILTICYTVFILSAILLSFIMIVNNGDAESYHVARAILWATNHNLLHASFPDIRAICLPINSELIYTWIITFTKNDRFLGFVGFSGYLLSIFAIFNLCSLLKMSMRRKLWIIFILSSLSSVIVQASGTETDIIIAGLITSSIYLFWTYLKTQNIPALYVSTLSYAIATGTKTTAIIAIPATLLLLITICHFENKKFKEIAKFSGIFCIFFIIFSSCNYILNFLDFHNFTTSDSFLTVSKNYYGIKGTIATFIKHLFLFIDFTGIEYSNYLQPYLTTLKTTVLNLLHVSNIPDGFYSSNKYFQNTLLEPMMGAGILGFLVYMPCAIWSILKPIKNHNEKSKKLFLFGLTLFINILILSYLLCFMTYSIRFLMSFMLISAPVLAYSYFRKNKFLKIFKYIIILISAYYLCFVSTNLWGRPLYSIYLIKKHEKIPFSEIGYFLKSHFKDSKDFYLTAKNLEKITLKNHILLLTDADGITYYVLKQKLINPNIDIKTIENDTLDFSKYNVIITDNSGQVSTTIKNFKTNAFENTQNTTCGYGFNKQIPKSIKQPFESVCIVKPEYFEENNFKLYQEIKVKDLENNVKDYLIFVRVIK